MATKTEQRIDARALASLMTDPVDAPHGLGLARTWSVSDGAKRVRSIARDTIDRFINRTGYTAHAYTLAEAAQIVGEARDHGRGSGTVTADAIRTAAKASKPASKGSTRKPASKPAAAAPEAQSKGTDAQ